MAVSQEAPVWATREYWGGVDVDAPGTYNPSTPRPRTVGNRVQYAANYVLATALESVISGEFEEREATSWGGFDPKDQELDDGALLLMERECMTRLNYYEGWVRHVNDSRGDLPDDIADFSEHWRERIILPRPSAFAEIRRFGPKGKELAYQRSLQWGVLVTQGGEKVVLSWDPAEFVHAMKLDKDDDGVRFHPRLHTVEVLPTPMTMGRAEATRHGKKSAIVPRSIERTTRVHVVEAEGAADYERAYKNSNPLFGVALNKDPGEVAALYRGAEIAIAGFMS